MMVSPYVVVTVSSKVTATDVGLAHVEVVIVELVVLLLDVELVVFPLEVDVVAVFDEDEVDVLDEEPVIEVQMPLPASCALG